MKTLTKVMAVGASIVSLAFAGLTLMPVAADSPGQIGGGNIYQAKNLTQGTGYADPQTANACDELQYDIQLHNPDFGAVTNLNVSVNLPSAASTQNVSTMTATYSGGVANSTSDTATVNLTSAQSLSYENGTAQLFDGNDHLVKTLPDTITSSGVNLGTLDGSGLEFVNFKVKVSCPSAPIYTCDQLGVTAGDNRTVTVSAFNVTASNGATFKNADINWGDGNTDSGLNPVVGKTHQYNADGTYTIAATAHFTVNGQDKTAGGVSCEQVVTYTSTTPPTVTTPTPTPSAPAPTALVNTGAGSVVGLFAAATAVGAVAYRWMTSRRLSRQ